MRNKPFPRKMLKIRSRSILYNFKVKSEVTGASEYCLFLWKQFSILSHHKYHPLIIPSIAIFFHLIKKETNLISFFATIIIKFIHIPMALSSSNCSLGLTLALLVSLLFHPSQSGELLCLIFFILYEKNISSQEMMRIYHLI